MLAKLIKAFQRQHHRQKYQPGAHFSRFVARDIRREIIVVNAKEVDDGYIIAKCRTWNLLYAAKGIVPKPKFGEPKRMAIATLWEWKGPSWGGPVLKEK